MCERERKKEKEREKESEREIERERKRERERARGREREREREGETVSLSDVYRLLPELNCTHLVWPLDWALVFLPLTPALSLFSGAALVWHASPAHWPQTQTLIRESRADKHGGSQLIIWQLIFPCSAIIKDIYHFWEIIVNLLRISQLTALVGLPWEGKRVVVWPLWPSMTLVLSFSIYFPVFFSSVCLFSQQPQHVCLSKRFLPSASSLPLNGFCDLLWAQKVLGVFV